MLRTLLVAAVVLCAWSAPAAQTRRPGAADTRPRSERLEMTCPSPLGTGVKTSRLFCDVLAGRDPAGGIIIKLPKRSGPATLMFDLHNRHTYSAEQERTGRAFTRYTATIGVLTLENVLLSRAVVRTEFRREADLFDRIAGGAGPGGVKAVAPTGVEAIALTIEPDVEVVSILGERLATARVDGDATYSAPGRPVAVISEPMLEYRPAPQPARRPPARRR